jgi:hypothetical protein
VFAGKTQQQKEPDNMFRFDQGWSKTFIALSSFFWKIS